MRIFLIGFMGSGKTTIGRKLAAPIGFDFIDADHYIEQKSGLSVAQIFEQQGEVAFRKIEHNALLELLQRDYVVISTGGGMPCYNNNIDLMLANGKVIYLKTSPQALTKRLMRSRTERPLIKDRSEAELRQYIEERLTEREPVYNRAHISIQTENITTEEILRTLHLMKK